MTTSLQGTYYRDTWADVNLDAIIHNVRAVQKHVGPDVQIMAVVKANAYGHGACQVAEAALEAGARCLGVATLDEALQLRQSGIDVPILVLGHVSPRYAVVAARHQITLTVVSVSHAEQLAASMTTAQGPLLDVHLKIDTGMARLGVRHADELLQAVMLIGRHPYIRLTGAFTHLAQSDARDLSFSIEQLKKSRAFFELLKQAIPNEGPLLFHAANSGGILQLPDSYFNMVRLGISLYGVYPSKNLKNHSVTLIQSLRLMSRIGMLKEVPPGTAIGYGGTFVTTRTTRVATIPIGYGDGLPRSLSNRGYFRIHGERCPIIGRVCMDQTLVDVTSLSDVQEGDEVVIYDNLTLIELAELANTIPYELLCAIAPRVPRCYWRGE
ncbi:alanine racemase [Alicyclobacillus shizuokensis]|uniref:alanine racemase n=1 Tax=Alicyclobacillus shizuokensis TaxID=392014 RepID=UPI000835AF14|nr:alanine racemase [Alicyclobacillus shizuokensis]